MPTYDEPPTESHGSEPLPGAAAVLPAVSAALASLGEGVTRTMSSETKAMLDSAKAGGFRVSEGAAQPIRDALARVRTRVSELTQDFAILTATEPPLGDHQYGRSIAAVHQQSAGTDNGSALVVLEKLEQVLIDADEALKIAVKNYGESESSALSSLKSGEV